MSDLSCFTKVQTEIARRDNICMPPEDACPGFVNDWKTKDVMSLVSASNKPVACEAGAVYT